MDLIERIRSSIEAKARVIGVRDVSKLLKLHDKLVLENAELRNEIEMWAANSDEAALKMARLQAQVDSDCIEAANSATTAMAKKLLEDDGTGAFSGDMEGRLQIEWRSIRAQLVQARSLGYR